MENRKYIAVQFPRFLTALKPLFFPDKAIVLCDTER